jgi:hypothetical protein
MKTEPHLSNDIIINKFKGIENWTQRYAETDQNSSDLAFLASEKQFETAVLILKQSTTLFFYSNLEM